MRKHLFLTLLLACGMPITAYANPEPQASQQTVGTITGTVVDENGDPVSAPVFLKRVMPVTVQLPTLTVSSALK